MKKLLIITTALISVYASASVVFAADSFYVEIGNQSTAEAVKEQWNDLSVKHKNLLAGLKFFPKQVTSENGQSSSIIQAGPIFKKAQAQKICATLFAKKIPCFVIDGIGGDAPPTVSTTMSKALVRNIASRGREDITSPWVDDAPAVLASANPANSESPEKSVVIGQIVEPDHESVEVVKQTNKPKAEDKNEARVEVAQAIAVPLSSEVDTKAVILSNDEEYSQKKSEPEVKQKIETKQTIDKKPVADKSIADAILAEKIATKELKPVDVLADSGGWLSVGGFENEGAARNFWSELSYKKPDLTTDLRTRFSHSLLSSTAGGGGKFTVGPFSGSVAASQFCKQAKLLNSRITCRAAEVDSPASSEDVGQPSSSAPQPSNPYEERRQLLLQQNKPSKSSKSKKHSKSLMDSSAPSQVFYGKKIERTYWAQVALTDSKEEAKNRLSEIKSTNPDILGTLSGRVTSSSSNNARYSASLGPINSQDEAEKICDAMQLRGTDCLVFATK